MGIERHIKKRSGATSCECSRSRRKSLQYLNSYHHILLGNVFGRIVTDATFTTYKEHGNIGQFREDDRIVSCTTRKSMHRVPHLLYGLREQFGKTRRTRNGMMTFQI